MIALMLFTLHILVVWTYAAIWQRINKLDDDMKRRSLS